MSQYSPGPFGFNQSQPLQYESNVSSKAIASFFNAVYAWMAVGLAVTSVTAYWVSAHRDLLLMTMGPMRWALLIVEIVLVVAISSAIQRISTAVATGLFILFAAVNGMTLSVIFLAFHSQVIALAFVVSAGMFAATSIYGFVTRTDLSRLGGILFMVLIGIVLASLANFFFRSPALYWIITYVGVFCFMGLTAYDTQRLKAIAVQTENNSTLAARLSVVGSLVLYLDFINLFLFILQIFGNRRQ